MISKQNDFCGILSKALKDKPAARMLLDSGGCLEISCQRATWLQVERNSMLLSFHRGMDRMRQHRAMHGRCRLLQEMWFLVGAPLEGF